MYTEKQVVDFTEWIRGKFESVDLWSTDDGRFELAAEDYSRDFQYTSAELFQYWLSENYLKA